MASVSKQMKFCPNCQKKLSLIRELQGINTFLGYRCFNCGYTEAGSLVPEEPASIGTSTPEETVVVIGEEEQKLRTMPTVKAECPKCYNDLSYVWQVQTRSADEGATQFFRCTKCGYTWRLYT